MTNAECGLTEGLIGDADALKLGIVGVVEGRGGTGRLGHACDWGCIRRSGGDATKCHGASSGFGNRGGKLRGIHGEPSGGGCSS